MIVRIAGEGRWRLGDEAAKQLLADDLRLMLAVDDQREVEYGYLLVALCRFVRSHGQNLSADDDGEADITVPSPQMSLAETIDLLSERRGLRPEDG